MRRSNSRTFALIRAIRVSLFLLKSQKFTWPKPSGAVMDFTNKLVVITGVGRAGQVGEALALGFAQRGATLALLDLQLEQVEARADDLRKAGYTVSAHAANL